jgi:phage/plasmid-like protein (TIGR03299 family)
MAEVLSEVNDLNDMFVDVPDFEGGLERQIENLTQRYRWDAAEMGLTLEQAVANLRAADTPEARAKVIADLKRRAIERASLDASTGKVAVFVAGEQAWHRLGRVVDKAATSAEAIKLALLDWVVEKRPLFLENESKVPGAFATVRKDTGAALGVVGGSYVPLQNESAFKFMDALVGEGLAMYETAGALNGGRRVWMLARIPKELRVGKGDVVQPYVMLTNRHDGGGAVRVLPTSIRVCCQNTLNMSLRGRGASKEGLSIRHTKNVQAAVEEAREKLGIIIKGVDTFQAQIDALAKVSLKETEVRDYFEQLYPTGKRRVQKALPMVDDGTLLDNILGAKQAGGEVVRELLAAAEEEQTRTQKRNTKIFEQIMENFHNEKNTLPGIKGTAWAAYNAVSEYVDWQSNVRGKDDLAKANSRMNSIFFGAGAERKAEAFELALQMAGASGVPMAV